MVARELVDGLEGPGGTIAADASDPNAGLVERLGVVAEVGPDDLDALVVLDPGEAVLDHAERLAAPGIRIVDVDDDVEGDDVRRNLVQLDRKRLIVAIALAIEVVGRVLGPVAELEVLRLVVADVDDLAVRRSRDEAGVQIELVGALALVGLPAQADHGPTDRLGTDQRNSAALGNDGDGHGGHSCSGCGCFAGLGRQQNNRWLDRIKST